MELKRLWRKKGFLLKPMCCSTDKAPQVEWQALFGSNWEREKPTSTVPRCLWQEEGGFSRSSSSHCQLFKALLHLALVFQENSIILGNYFKGFLKLSYFSPFSVAAHHNAREGPAACGVANLAPWILTAFSSPTIDFLLGLAENSAYYKNHNWGRAMLPVLLPDEASTFPKSGSCCPAGPLCL